MDDHKAQRIKDAVSAQLADWFGVAYQLFPNRVYPLHDDDLPAVVVRYGPDIPLGNNSANNLTFLDSELRLFVEVYTKAKQADFEAELMAARTQIHQAIMAETTQGFDFVWRTVPLGSEEPEIDAEGELPVAVLRTDWAIHYRMQYRDPSQ